MRRLPRATLLLLLAFAACSDSSNPTQPPGPAPFPMGVAKATALENLPLIRQLQNQKKAGTLLVGLSAGCVDLEGRLCPGESWSYSFSDRSGPGDLRYNWSVRDTGLIQSFDPVPATGPASGIDIGPFLQVDSSQAAAIGFAERGEAYFQQFPDGFLTISYRHFAGQVRVTALYRTLSSLCRVEVEISAASGAVLAVDDCCLTGAC